MLTTTVLLVGDVSIEIPEHVIADLTPEELVECRAAAVRALVERVEEIRASKVPAGRVEYQCPSCEFYVYSEDDALTAAMIEEHRATHR